MMSDGVFIAAASAAKGFNNQISAWRRRQCPSLVCIVPEAGNFQSESGSSLLPV